MTGFIIGIAVAILGTAYIVYKIIEEDNRAD